MALGEMIITTSLGPLKNGNHVSILYLCTTDPGSLLLQHQCIRASWAGRNVSPQLPSTGWCYYPLGGE